MVQTQVRGYGSIVERAAHGRAITVERGAVGRVAGFPSGRIADRPRTATTVGSRVAARARGRAMKATWAPYGDAAEIIKLSLCLGIICALGVIYLTAYATVAIQGRQVHALQSQVAAANAQHEVLLAQYTFLSSGARVQQAAADEGMVSGAPTEYVTLSANTPGAARVTQVAMAR
jgi:cell division protein FtsL